MGYCLSSQPSDGTARGKLILGSLLSYEPQFSASWFHQLFWSFFQSPNKASISNGSFLYIFFSSFSFLNSTSLPPSPSRMFASYCWLLMVGTSSGSFLFFSSFYFSLLGFDLLPLMMGRRQKNGWPARALHNPDTPPWRSRSDTRPRHPQCFSAPMLLPGFSCLHFGRHGAIAWLLRRSDILALKSQKLNVRKNLKVIKLVASVKICIKYSTIWFYIGWKQVELWGSMLQQVELWGSVPLSEHGQFMGCFFKTFDFIL